MGSHPHALPAGTEIAGFRIARVLGVGGFGITYEAVDNVTRRRFAIKEFFPRGLASRQDSTLLVYASNHAALAALALEKFERSSAQMGALRHPNIVEVLHYVKQNGTGYMIMEYIEGVTLDVWLEKRGAPPGPAELRGVLEPILDALAYVHGQGLIHRDIAPDNIMIDRDGRPVLIDFGAVKVIEQHNRAARSFLVAKRNYSPPEQTQEGVELDRTADVYSLGAVLYVLLTGFLPFELRIGGSSGSTNFCDGCVKTIRHGRARKSEWRRDPPRRPLRHEDLSQDT